MTGGASTTDFLGFLGLGQLEGNKVGEPEGEPEGEPKKRLIFSFLFGTANLVGLCPP